MEFILVKILSVEMSVLKRIAVFECVWLTTACLKR